MAAGRRSIIKRVTERYAILLKCANYEIHFYV